MRFRRFVSSMIVAFCLPAGAFAQAGLPVSIERAPEGGVGPKAADVRPRAYMIELTSEPTAVTYAKARDHALAKGRTAAEAIADTAAVSQLALVEREQAPIVSALQSGDIDGTFLYSVQRVENGVAALLTADEAARVAAMPGVRAVRPIETFAIDTAAAVPLVGAPGLWSPTTGSAVRGDGIRLGIIDSGVDYLHADLGGPGVYNRTDFTAADVPWNAKVVGGIDLAGDDYDVSSSDPRKWVPHPDADPMDCGGHGTHVAGIAAGIGVRSDGTPFSGPYPSTLDPAAFRIGPGVAPAAKLYAIRIFGCSGTTNLAEKALDWALDPNQDGNLSDHLDVVNLSIGAIYGETFWRASTPAAENAAAAGMFVVASAGNSGKQHFIVGSPSVATRALSVAASGDSTDTVDAFTINSPSSIAGAKPALPSSAFKWSAMKTPLTGDVVYPPTQRTGCETFTPANAALLAGKIALLDWTDDGCNSRVRVANAAAAGAAGVLFAYTKPERLDIAIGGSEEIPAMLTNGAVADAIKNALPANVTFDPQIFGRGVQRIVDDRDTDTLASFSSRGPRPVDGLLKPDISAPGVSIFSAQVRGGNLGSSREGTSMAGPIVAGGMALLKQIHPDWSVEELKALAMNSATSDIHALGADTLESPQAAGVGRLSLPDAQLLDVIAYAVDKPGSVGISFGMVEVPGQIAIERQFKVVNKSTAPAVVTLAYTPITDVPGVSFDFPGGTTLNIAANGSTIARIRLSADAAAMRHVRDPLLEAKQGGYPRYWITEASGRIEMMRGFTPLRLPVHAMVRPASTMSAATKSVALTAQSGHAEIALSGGSFATGSSYPNDWVSLVAPFELQASLPRKASLNAWQNLRYVGVASDYEAKNGSVADTMIYFGIASWGSWSSPAQVDFKVLIDTQNTNGFFQRVVYNTNGGTFLGSDTNDVHIAAVCPWPRPPLPSSQCSSQYMNGFAGDSIDTAVLNNNVMRFPVRASALGLTSGKTRFAYTVVSYDKITGAVLDQTPRLWFDPAHALNLFGTTTNPSGIYFDRATNAIPIDWGAGDVGSATAILLLHYFNSEGTRAEVVPINAATKHRTARH